MTISFILENLINTDILKRLRDVFKSLCGLELCFLQTNGVPRPIMDSAQSSQSVARRFSRRGNTSVPCQFGGCQAHTISPQILARVLETREPETFTCSSGDRRGIVPVVVNGEVAAFLVTGDRADRRLDEAQIRSIISLLKQLVDYMVKNELKFLNDFKGNPQTHQQKLLNRVTRYIWENYHLPELSLEKISKANGISYHYLSRLFKREMKTSFAQYRNKVRLDIARKLLKDLSLTVNQISYECGFEDQGYFSKVFKENFGMSPNDYRRKPSRVTSAV